MSWRIDEGGHFLRFEIKERFSSEKSNASTLLNLRVFHFDVQVVQHILMIVRAYDKPLTRYKCFIVIVTGD